MLSYLQIIVVFSGLVSKVHTSIIYVAYTPKSSCNLNISCNYVTAILVSSSQPCVLVISWGGATDQLFLTT